MILEACVETLQQAIAAELNGATQIELCAHLEENGLTPPLSLVREVLKTLSIPIKVIIRPQNDFQYSPLIMNEMIESIQTFEQEAISGFVFGMLDEKSNVHLDSIKQLCKLAGSIPCTFHKAIDITPNPFESCAQLASVPNLKSILTSGGALTAAEGVTVLNQMHTANPSLEIIAAGSITYLNLLALRSKSTLQAFHGRRIVPGIL